MKAAKKQSQSPALGRKLEARNTKLVLSEVEWILKKPIGSETR